MAHPKLLTFLLIPMFFLSCRKDVLHWQKAERLETHTTTDRFNKVYFINDTTGFVIGGSRFEKATILTTRDGGNTWSYAAFPEAGKSLYGIAQVPGGRLYVVGFDGRILYQDEGDSWQYKPSGRVLPFKDIAVTGGQRAIIVGGISFREGFRFTVNGDTYPISFDSTAYELNDIEMADEKYGYIAGYGVVMATSDSGKNWEVQDIENDNFTSVHALNTYEAWTCGYYGSIYHTSNRGRNWEQLRNGNDLTQPAYRLLDILFTDPQNGFAVGENGVVIYTDDGGRHWMEFDKFTNSHLRDITALKGGSLLVCGDGGSLYKLHPAYFH